MLKLKQKKYWDMEYWSTVATEFKITGQNSVQSQIFVNCKEQTCLYKQSSDSIYNISPRGLTN